MATLTANTETYGGVTGPRLLAERQTSPTLSVYLQNQVEHRPRLRLPPSCRKKDRLGTGNDMKVEYEELCNGGINIGSVLDNVSFARLQNTGDRNRIVKQDQPGSKTHYPVKSARKENAMHDRIWP
jgi:hypothetical protein